MTHTDADKNTDTEPEIDTLPANTNDFFAPGRPLTLAEKNLLARYEEKGDYQRHLALQHQYAASVNASPEWGEELLLMWYQTLIKLRRIEIIEFYEAEVRRANEVKRKRGRPTADNDENMRRLFNTATELTKFAADMLVMVQTSQPDGKELLHISRRLNSLFGVVSRLGGYFAANNTATNQEDSE